MRPVQTLILDLQRIDQVLPRLIRQLFTRREYPRHGRVVGEILRAIPLGGNPETQCFAPVPGSTPISGDVLVVSRDGRHFLSIFPEKAQVSFELPSEAWEFARRWVERHPSASVWHQEEESVRAVNLADLPRAITRRQAGLRASE